MPLLNAWVRNTIPYDDQSPTAASARAFLARLNLVRMRQDSCPGSGHFAAGRAALDGLIRLGFQGTIEVCHVEDDDSLKNMSMCYAGWRQGGSHLDVDGPRGNHVGVDYVPVPGLNGLRMMAQINALNQFFAMRPAAPLGVFGASDGYGTADDPLPQVVPAQDLNAQCSVVLQPFGWPNIRMVEDRRNGARAPTRRKILLGAQGALASYLINVADPLARLPQFRQNQPGYTLAFKSYVDDNAGNLNDREQATVVATLAKAAAGGCYLMPIYGLHANCPGPWAIDALVRAFHTMSGLGLLQGPIVLFNIRGSYNVNDARTLALCTHLHADNAATARTIANAQDGIFVVRAAAGLPNELFQQIAANASLPMLLEGANTANLCIQLGIPYLAMSDNPSIPTVDVDGKRGHVALRALTGFLWGRNRAADPEVNQIVEALTDILVTHEELYEYYLHLHQYARQHDQLEYALANLENNGPQLMLQQPPIVQQPVVPQPVVQPDWANIVHVCKNPRCHRKGTRVGPGNCTGCGSALSVA